MRLRVYGFTFEKKSLANALPMSSIFGSLEAKQTLAQDGLDIRHGITIAQVVNPFNASISPWWIGLILKVRDSRNFTKLTAQTGGGMRLTADLLASNEALAEVNFFVAHPNSGAGLYAHYHQSASMTKDFGGLVHDTAICMRDAAIKTIHDNASLTGKQRKA